MLYIISTPIGNLRDISLRAIEVLEKVDVLLCEDTRVSGNLLKQLNIKNKPKLVPFYDEVEERKISEVVGYIKEGKEVGLVSDAGTPLLSDPGWKLVRYCQKMGYKYTAIPGANAITNALVLSGLPTDKFVFLGFLPKKEVRIKKVLEEFKSDKLTKVAYESPKRVGELIRIIKEICGEKVSIKVVREMTKMFEEVIDSQEFSEGKGEVTVVWR